MRISVQHDLARCGVTYSTEVEGHTLTTFVADEAIVGSQGEPLGKGMYLLVVSADQYAARIAEKREAERLERERQRIREEEYRKPCIRTVLLLGGPKHGQHVRVDTRNREVEFMLPFDSMIECKPYPDAMDRIKTARYRKAYHRRARNCIAYMYSGDPLPVDGSWALA